MTPERAISDSLRTLLDAACFDELTDEQFAQLEAELAASADARREYLRYFTLTGELRYLVSMGHADEAARERTGRDEAAVDLYCETPRSPSAAPLPTNLFQGMADGLSLDWPRSIFDGGGRPRSVPAGRFDHSRCPSHDS